MELSVKLQELRKKKGLTQEELAEAIFVSRTAVSKWESGRGYPSIDSLKSIAKFFSVSIDELLSGDELLIAAEEEQSNTKGRYRDLVFGLLDVSVALLFFLPFFAQSVNGDIQEVSLISLSGIGKYLKVIYAVLVSVTIVWGIATLALQNLKKALWLQSKNIVSILLSVALVLAFMVSRQPYGAVFAFVFFAIKALILVKK